MATHSHDGLIYEALGIEFQEFSRSGFSHGPSLDISRAPSDRSGLTGDNRVHDDDISLIAHQEVSAPEFIPNKASNDCGTPSQLLRERRYRFKSWKIGVTSAAVMTTTVLLINLLLTVWASVKFGLDGGIGTVYEGACSTVSAWSFWLHIIINGLSSMLLSASNYTMQCVTAPTRRECDLAHARGDWLDIGVPSLRNLSRISWKRRIMWTLLAVSSMPIHLLYNSAVFKTLDDNHYDRLIVGRKFLEKSYHMPSIDAIMNTTSTLNIRYSREEVFAFISTMHETYFSSPFKNLSIDVCISTYATYYLSGHSNVFLIADDTDNEIIPVEPASAPQAPTEFDYGW
jgi:membrane-associated phospholipid phosphatase